MFSIPYKDRAWYLFGLILFSGPPRIRVRDAEASLAGQVDAAAMVQLVVWLSAAIFVAKNLWGSEIRLTITRIHRLTLFLLLSMAASIFVSLSPPLTAVKVFQIITEFSFLWMFVQRFGAREFFRVCLVGTTIMCGIIYFCWFFFPEPVVTISESGDPRLQGFGIYDTGYISALGIILLLCLSRRCHLSNVWLVFFTVPLVASLARTHWVAVCIVFLLALIMRPQILHMRWVYGFWVLSPFAISKLGVLLDKTRQLESLIYLNGRFFLWDHIISTTLSESPFLGYGFSAASRILGLEASPELGSGHSIFIDVFGGTGIAGTILFLCLCFYLVKKACSDALSRSQIAFTSFALLVVLLVIGLVGGELETTPFGFVFWGLVSVIAFHKGSALPAISQQPTRSLEMLP